jgi:CRP/FNR family cyclic AMP-dependent transcriptional regulator
MRTAKDDCSFEPDSKTFPVGNTKPNISFDPATLLAKAGASKTVVKETDALFSQDDPAHSVFYIRRGQVKLAVSQRGKEVSITQLGTGDFVGEECLASDHPKRIATATALTECTVLRVDRKEMLRLLHEEPAFSGLFVSYLLARSTNLEADLVE